MTKLGSVFLGAIVAALPALDAAAQSPCRDNAIGLFADAEAKQCELELSIPYVHVNLYVVAVLPERPEIDFAHFSIPGWQVFVENDRG